MGCILPLLGGRSQLISIGENKSANNCHAKSVTYPYVNGGSRLRRDRFHRVEEFLLSLESQEMVTLQA